MKSKKSVASAKNKKSNSQPAAKIKSDKKTVANHKQAAAHHMEAAKHHTDAAKYYENGNYEKAAHSTVLAYGHNAIAGEFVSDDAKHHAQVLKRTNYRF
jgi:hypothetical protein